MSADKPKHGTTPAEHHTTDVSEPSPAPTETVEASAAAEKPENSAGLAKAHIMSGSGASTHPTGR